MSHLFSARSLRRSLLILVVVLTASMSLALAHQLPAHAAAGGDFEMRYQTSSTATATVAYLVRGGLPNCNPALNCNGGLVEPKVTT